MRYIRNTEVGTIHRIGDDGSSHEEDNLDALREAGHADEISEDEALAELQEHPERACGHCMASPQEFDPPLPV